MFKTEEREVTIQERFVVDVCCDSCGKSCRVDGEEGKPETFVYEYASFSKTWGYFSKKDGTHDQFLICECCYDKMTTFLGIKFEGEDDEDV